MQHILFHICCGPCAIYPLKKILDGKIEVCGFFFNPNIHPYTEYKKRLEAVKILSSKIGIKMIYRDEYNLEEFLQNTVGTDLKSAVGTDLKSAVGTDLKSVPKYSRCGYCYSHRLEATAKAAKENGFDGFSSSLLYSKYQNHEMIKNIGNALADKYGISFYYDDFRTGWAKGISYSKEMGLYRQQYCGCIFSEKERYLGEGRKIVPSPQSPLLKGDENPPLSPFSKGGLQYSPFSKGGQGGFDGFSEQKRQKGFTLIEFIMVIIIVSILAATAVPRFGQYWAGIKTGNAAMKIVSDLRFAQNRATTTQQRSQVNFATAGTGYTIYSCATYTSSSCTCTTWATVKPIIDLSGDFSGVTIATMPTNCMEFDALGRPYYNAGCSDPASCNASSGQTFAVQYSGSSKTITIQVQTGMVSY